MATTFVDYTGDGNATKSFSFPSYKVEDIKVKVDDVVKTVSTHYNITSYTATGGGNVVFTSGNIPASPADIHIYRDTDVDSAKATYTAGSSVKAGDLNNNHTQLLYALQEEQNQLIRSGNIKDAAVITSKIKDLSVTTAKIAADAITGAKLSDNCIGTEHLQNDAVRTSDIKDLNVTTDKLAADAVTGAKIADDSINSEHYAATSIDTEHIANENVTTSKLANNAVTSAKIADSNVITAKLADDAVTNAKIGASAVGTGEIAADAVTNAKIATGAISSGELAADSVTTDKIAVGQVTVARLASDSVSTAKIIDLNVTTAKIASTAITAGKLASDAVETAKINDSAVTTAKIADNAVNMDKIADATIITNSEQAASTPNDTTFFTTAAAEARYFNASTGETIKDGDTFPDNDTTIATTAAINDRIIDLVDDVGGFVPIASETAFPSANPDVNNGSGTLVSIKAIGSTRTPSSGTVSISNGSGSNTVTITGCGSTVLTAGFGVIVETTSTLHTYAFHRLVPKATEVTTVAGISSNITTVANNTSNINAVAADASDIGVVAADGTDIGLVAGSISNVNTVAGDISNVNAVAGNATNINAVAGNNSNVTSVAGNASNINSAVSNASNINSAVSNASNINTVAGSISNVNTTAGSIANVNTAASNIANVNNFAATYQIASSAPSTDGAGNALAAGDLYFDTSANELRVHNGSTFQGGVTATGNLAGTGANTFTGNQTIQNDSPSLSLVDSGHNPDYEIKNADGVLRIRDTTNAANRIMVNTDGHIDLKSNVDCEAGLDVTGNITVSGNVDGRDVAADGTKLDGIEASAKDDQTAGEIKTLFNSHGLTNAQIDAGAAIAGTKISPDFGSQNIATTGDLNAKDITLTDGSPAINFTDNDANPDYQLQANAGNFYVKDTTNGQARITVNSDGHVDIPGNLDAGAGIDVTGNITVSGTVDGVDIAALNTTVGNITTDLVSDTSPQLGGTLQSNGHNIDFADNNSARFGTGNDLNIYHNGTDSVIDNNTNNLEIVTQNSMLFKIADAELAIVCNKHGGVDLYHDNNKKFETESFGATLTGNLDVTNGDVKLQSDNNKITFGAGADLQIYHSGSQSIITDTAHPVFIKGNQVHLQSANGNMISCYQDAQTELFHNESKKLETASTGVTVTGNIAVTGTVDGRDVASDGSKLDGIEASATADQTAAEIKTLLQSNKLTASEIANDTITAVQLANNSANVNVIVDGAVTNAKIATMAASKLTGALPAIDGSALTGISAGATGGGSDEVFYENGQTVTTNYTITNGKNAMAAGPITINSGVTVTVGSGENLTIV